jgi:hypothetical protein
MRPIQFRTIRQELINSLCRARVLTAELLRTGEPVETTCRELTDLLADLEGPLAPNADAATKHLKAAIDYLKHDLPGPARFHLRHLARLLDRELAAWGA